MTLQHEAVAGHTGDLEMACLAALTAEADRRQHCARRGIESAGFAAIMLDQFASGLLTAAACAGLLPEAHARLHTVLDQRMAQLDPNFAATRAARLAASQGAESPAGTVGASPEPTWREVAVGSPIQAGDRVRRPSGAWMVIMASSPLVGQSVREGQTVQRRNR